MADSAEEHRVYQAAVRDFEAGQLEAAEAAFSDFVKRFPKSGWADNALYQLGMIYSMTGRKREGLEAFELCVQAYAGTDAAPLAEAQAKILQDEIAVTEIAEVRELFHAGRNLAAKGDLAGAEEVFRRCLAEHPDHALADNVYLSLSMIFSLEGKFSQARKTLETILERFPDSDAAATVPAALRQLERDERYQ